MNQTQSAHPRDHGNLSPCHCMIITHTHERIANTLISLKSQTHPPATITVSSDHDDSRIVAEVTKAVKILGREVLLVMREQCESSRRSQNRNNAVRALINHYSPADQDILVFLDGDCIPGSNFCEEHFQTLKQADVSLGYAIRMNESQTNLINEHSTDHLAEYTESLLTDTQRSEPITRHQKSKKQIFLRKLRLTKPHKPKLLSGNFAVKLRNYQLVNGFDESFTGWGSEDDDIARRLYASGARPCSTMDRAVVYHQHHPTESNADWKANPNSQRLSQSFQSRALHGLDTPVEQPEPKVTLISPVYD